MVTPGIDPDRSIDVGFATTSFTLMAAGTCSGLAACGHVHLYLDDAVCNNVPAGKSYNNSGPTSPIKAKLSWCPTNTGPHTIRLELHDDVHAPVLGAGGTVVSATTNVMAQVADANPAVANVWPVAASTVTMGTDADKTVPIYFTAANFTFKAAGTCGTTPNCGHAHLNIDGDACDNVAAGKTYNSSNSADGLVPIKAKLSLCPNPTGQHTFVVTLHHDDHSPVQVSGQTVAATTIANVQ
jgi:hypothetical protein